MGSEQKRSIAVKGVGWDGVGWGGTRLDRVSGSDGIRAEKEHCG